MIFKPLPAMTIKTPIFVFNAVPADGLAPIYAGLALE